jgi:two-component sensor histidine kinase
MKKKLFYLLRENLQDFFNRDDVCDLLGDFYFGENTIMLFARAVEAVYNAMKYAAQLEKTQGE